MRYNQHSMIFAAMITTCFTAGAQEVFESVDQQGVVEFSDQPSQGAKEIDVRPNVVDVTPLGGGEPSPPVAATGEANVPDGNLQPKVIHDGVADDYYGGYENRRPLYREDEGRRNYGKDAARLPAQREPGREAVREGVHRR